MSQATAELPHGDSRRDQSVVHCTISTTGTVQLVADRTGHRVLLDVQDRRVDVAGYAREGHAFVQLSQTEAAELLAELTAAIAEAAATPPPALRVARSRHPSRRAA